MPKFEFDPRTGGMVPKENKQIYFAGAMSGGLRVDDRINNITYIIEHDGSVRNLFGVRGNNLRIYDQRNAHIIADRVLRKLGPDNPYSDYRMFLRR